MMNGICSNHRLLFFIFSFLAVQCFWPSSYIYVSGNNYLQQAWWGVSKRRRITFRGGGDNGGVSSMEVPSSSSSTVGLSPKVQNQQQSKVGWLNVNKNSKQSNNGNMISVGVINLSTKSELLQRKLLDRCKEITLSSILEDISDCSTNCFLVPCSHSKNDDPAIMKIKDLPDDKFLAEGLALLCDVVLLIVTDDTTSKMSNVIDALQKGSNRRFESDVSSCFGCLNKSKLVVVIPDEEDTVSEGQEDDTSLPSSSTLRDRLMQTQLVGFTPRTWERLEIVTQQQLDDQWEDIISIDPYDSSSLVVDIHDDTDESRLFIVKLLHEIYTSLWNGSTENTEGQNIYLPSFQLTKVNIIKPPQQQQQHQQQQTIHDDHEMYNTDVDGNIQTATNKKDDALVEDVLSIARSQIDALETKMDEIWLQTGDENDYSDNNDINRIIPMLDFGDRVDTILNQTYERLGELSNDNDQERRITVSLQVASKVKQLYEQHLNSLRDYYGKRYEVILETSIKDDSEKDDDKKDRKKRRNEQEQEWRDAAAHMTDGFRAAAQFAIPTLCRINGPLRDADFDYVVTLQGLIQDMMEATQSRKDDMSLAGLDEDDNDGESDDVKKRRRKGPKTWYEKVAARVIVMGVNYLQGWLAWQGVKRAAVQRDQTMPKFPLF